MEELINARARVKRIEEERKKDHSNKWRYTSQGIYKNLLTFQVVLELSHPKAHGVEVNKAINNGVKSYKELIAELDFTWKTVPLTRFGYMDKNIDFEQAWQAILIRIEDYKRQGRL